MTMKDLKFTRYFDEESEELDDELFNSILFREKTSIEVREPESKRMKLSSMEYVEYDGGHFTKNKFTFENAAAYNGVVMRSTRFSVITSAKFAVNMFTRFCTEMGMTIEQRSPCNFLITYAPEMSLMADIFEFSNGNETRAVLNCRRSRGCGLTFKKIFKTLKKKMQPVICPDDDEWMRNAGLIRQK